MHRQAEDLTVETVQDGRDVKLAVSALDLGNIRQKLPERFLCAEILLDEVFGLHCLRIGLCQPLRAPLSLMKPAVLPHEAGYPPYPCSDPTLSQRQLHPPHPVVVVPRMLVQNIFDYRRKKLVPTGPVLAPDPAIVARYADLQRPADILHRPSATVPVCEAIPQLRFYFFRFFAKKPSAS